MSLSQQFLLVISASLLLVFSINLITSVDTIRTYLQEGSQVHSQNTASALSLSLSPLMKDENDPNIENLMKAIFVSGYYQEIKLLNTNNIALVSLSKPIEFDGVPAWLIKSIPIKTARAESKILSDNHLYGTIYVTIDPSSAYNKLLQQLSDSFYYFLFVFAFSISLFLFVLRITTNALKNIDQMAITLAEGEFVTIDHLPRTTELRNVILSMNSLSKNFEKILANLKSHGKKLERDELTGLNKKHHFSKDLNNIFLSELEQEAYIFIIKIDSLTKMVKEQGNNTIDQFLKEIAQALNVLSVPNAQTKISAYRFLGSEFALLVKYATLEDTESIAIQLSKVLYTTGKKYQHPDAAHIGIAPFNLHGSAESILLAVNEAYEKARLIGETSYYIRRTDSQAKSTDEWKQLIFNSIDNDHYNVSFVCETKEFSSHKILMVDAYTQVFDHNDHAIEVGTFISIAEKYEKIVDLDKGITTKIINHINTNQIQHAVVINLSVRTIKSSRFRNWLTETLTTHQPLAQQLIFTGSAYAISNEMAVYKEFIAFIQDLGAKFMIKRFDIHTMSPDSIIKLNPNFIRLNHALSNGVTTNYSKKSFIETIQNIGAKQNICILAENVISKHDINWLKFIGITGASHKSCTSSHQIQTAPRLLSTRLA